VSNREFMMATGPLRRPYPTRYCRESATLPPITTTDPKNPDEMNLVTAFASS